MRFHKAMQGISIPPAPIVETVIPNPKLKLLDQISEVMWRLKQVASQGQPFVYHGTGALSLNLWR